MKSRASLSPTQPSLWIWSGPRCNLDLHHLRPAVPIRRIRHPWLRVTLLQRQLRLLGHLLLTHPPGHRPRCHLSRPCHLSPPLNLRQKLHLSHHLSNNHFRPKMDCQMRPLLNQLRQNHHQLKERQLNYPKNRRSLILLQMMQVHLLIINLQLSQHRQRDHRSQSQSQLHL